MRCDACGFDMGSGPGDSGLCMGCGVPLAPAKDHEKPWPGFSVDPKYDDPYIVSESDRKADRRLNGVHVIHRSNIKWGRGIGAETYGYYQRELVSVVAVNRFADNHEQECPDCGAERARYKYGFDGCVASYAKLDCESCGHTYFDHFDC